MIAEQSKAFGQAAREIGDQEIVERLVCALINEGARILAEGIAAARLRHRRSLYEWLWVFRSGVADRCSTPIPSV